MAILLGSLSLSPAHAGGDEITVYLTAKQTNQRLTRAAQLRFESKPQPLETEKTIFVDPSQQFQTFLGIGAALTDAAAETFYRLPRPVQLEFLKAHFDVAEGLGYTLVRTHINSCDFSSQSYTYVQPGDSQLTSFSIAPDQKFRIPFIKEVQAASGPGLKLYVSPWSPPGWMKDNGEMLHGGKLLPQHAGAWANYFVRFIKAYEQAGIPIWGLTVQNEPMAKQTWESCLYSASEERDFLKSHLGPALATAGLEDKKIIIWDHNRDLIHHRASTILDDPAAAKFVWGLGYHWYSGDQFGNVRLVHEAYPQLNMLVTEACNYPYSRRKLGDWQWGEKYGWSMINDFNSGAVGWTDWNILLDETGGPNHVKNFCYAPVHGDTRKGRLLYMNSYYYIGHFSKFIRPGARRVACSTMTDVLLSTAFLNADGTVAVVVMNRTEKAQPFLLWCGGAAAQAQSPAHSIQTLVFVPRPTAPKNQR